MPQAFTWCRVAAKPFGHASRVTEQKPDQQITPINPTFAQARVRAALAQRTILGNREKLVCFASAAHTLHESLNQQSASPDDLRAAVRNVAEQVDVMSVRRWRERLLAGS